MIEIFGRPTGAGALDRQVVHCHENVALLICSVLVGYIFISV